MYDISRSETGGVLPKCKLCAHTERVNEFDDMTGEEVAALRRRKRC
jgi:hypothetical protein